MRYRNALCVLFFSTIAGASTVWDGVYAGPQADRGQAAYTKNCGACHMADLAGRGEAPALKGDGFMDRWHDYSLRPLFSLIKTEMPPLRFRTPDTHPLPDDSYVDIIAYLLKVNGFPAGNGELTLANLNAVQILGKKGAAPPPNYALVLSVGCLAQDARERWILEGATSPVRATMPDQATPEEIQAARAKTFGLYQYRLADFGYLGSHFDPESLEDHKVQVKGYLIRQPEFERISVTSIADVSTRCE
jgi:hypothetical protein